MSRFSQLVTGAGGSPSADARRSSTRMEGNEPVWGVVLAGILIVVSVLNLTVTTGPGAPAHPSSFDSVIAIVLALALVVVSLRVRSRMVSPLVGIVAAFFTTLGKTPTSLSAPHIIALFAALAFALILSMRQRRVQRALTPQATAADRKAAADARRRRRKGEPEPPPEVKRPPRSKRYTPPRPATPPKSGRR